MRHEALLSAAAPRHYSTTATRCSQAHRRVAVAHQQQLTLAEEFAVARRRIMPLLREEVQALFSKGTPRGFGRFYPKEGGGASKAAEGGAKQGSEGAAGKASENGAKQAGEGAAKEAAGEGAAKEGGEGATKQGSSSSGGSSKSGAGGKRTEGKSRSGGSAGGGGNMPDLTPSWQSVAALAIILYIMTNSSISNMGEISWQEFQSKLLESGEVERIVVVNNKVSAAVHLLCQIQQAAACGKSCGKVILTTARFALAVLHQG